MLFCDKCGNLVSEGDELDHFLDQHKEFLLECIDDQFYDYTSYDPREEALTIGERNPTLK